MIVVSDTSALSAFILIGQLELLPKLYKQVIVPPAVMREIFVLESQFGHDLSILKNASWLDIIPVKDFDLFQRYRQVLDEGEAEALVLMQEMAADFLLIDEMKGRKVAQAVGIPHTGVLGVLLSAKANGFIPVVQPLLEALLTKAGFRMSRILYERVLQQAGEKTP